MLKRLGMDSLALTEYLLDEARIAVVPGTVFGEFGNEFIRISFASSYENLQEAMRRMNHALKKILGSGSSPP
jgi:aminotransferase